MEATGGRGWTAEEREMDTAEHIVSVKREGWKAVTRVKEMERGKESATPEGSKRSSRKKSGPIPEGALKKHLPMLTTIHALSG